MLECVRLLRLPGDCRALVSPAVAELAERMGEARRLDVPPGPPRQPMRRAARVPQSATRMSAPRVLGEIGLCARH